ncbi:MAG: TetR/AcrR family transcriptional regulator [Dehalococcoidia bacterium]
MAHLRDSDRLIDAAERVFKERGFPQARIEDIAAEVGLQKTSLYRHMDSKAELLFLVLRRDVARRVMRLVAILADPGSARFRLEAAIRTHLEYDLGDLPLRELVQTARPALRPEDASALRALEDQYAHLFRRIVQDAVESGFARSDTDISVMTRYLTGMINLAHAWYRPGRLSKREVIDIGVVVALGALGISATVEDLATPLSVPERP